MATIEVFYHASIGGRGMMKKSDTGSYFPDDLASLNLIPHEVDQEYPSARCPAQKEFWKNTWTCKTPFAIDMSLYHKQQKSMITNMDKDGADAVRWPQTFSWDGPMLEGQMSFNYLFWTKHPNIWVEQRASYDMTKRKVETVQGTFCISAWLRPMNFGFRTEETELTFPKGMDMFHVKVIDKENNANIKLTPVDTIPDWVHEKKDAEDNFKMLFKMKSWGAMMKRVKKGFTQWD